MQGSSISQCSHVFTLFTNGKESLQLRAGEMVSVAVVDVRSDNNATIRVNNTELEVQSEVPLQKGETLTLRVERQENSAYLRLSGRGAVEADSVKITILAALNKLDIPKPASEAMEMLVRLLVALPEPLKENLPEIDIISRFLLKIEDVSGKTLQDIFENGGVFFEAKLRGLARGTGADGASADMEAGRIMAGDLKASLLRLKDMFLAPAVLEHLRGRQNTDELLGALNMVIRNIEYYQLQSKLTDSLQFFLPIIWHDLRDGEVIMREYGRGKSGDLSVTCTVNLDLERAGRVRVNLISQGGCVHVTCIAEKSDFARLLQEGVAVLTDQFGAAGIRLGHIVVHQHPTINFDNNRSLGLSIRA